MVKYIFNINKIYYNSQIFHWCFSFGDKFYLIKLKDIFENKDSLLIAKNQTDYEKFDIPNKNNFSLSFIIDNLKFTISAKISSKYELFINSKNFNDFKICSTNTTNSHNTENKINNIDNNCALNNGNGFNKDIEKDIVSSNIKTKSRNNKSNLPYQSSDELIKIALKKNEKNKQKKPITPKDYNLFIEEEAKLPDFARNLPITIFHVYQYNNDNIAKICSICLEEFIIGKKYITLPCFHFFHIKCISDWLNRNKCCPLCKTEIIQK